MSRATADPNHALLKIAHHDLYERNPFNVLNLPVTATVRQIRRRKEDIEAAFDAGTEAVEFADILPEDEHRAPPTRAEVEDAFAALEDPERRIAYALFWFWPDTSVSKEQNPNLSIAQWLSSFDETFEARSDSPSLLMGCHNLAVLSHLMALGYEQSLLRDREWNGATPEEVRQHWKYALSFWNAVVSDAETWHEVSALVESLGDPRLDYRFVRSMRDQFAFAFDQINAELAIDFAKQERELDARRQVEYMHLSQPNADDVEGTFDNAFAGLLRQVEAVVREAKKEVEAKPEDGPRLVQGILLQTDEPLRISRIVFAQGNSIRELMVTKIFEGIRRCLIAYGNSTNDWDGCLRLTQRLDSLAETARQRELVAQDRLTLQQNKNAQMQRRAEALSKANEHLLRRVESLSQAAVEDSTKRPSAGLRHAEKLLFQSREWLDAARRSLPEGNQLRRAIVDTVISGVRECIINYGNKTADWGSCLKMVSCLWEIAETAGQRETLAQDEQTLAQRKKEKEIKETCWACKTNKAEARCAFKVPMYGDVQRDVVHGKILWQSYILRVPRCSKCMAARRNWLVLWVLLLIAFFGVPTMLGGIMAYHSRNTFVLEGCSVGLLIGMAMLLVVMKVFKLEQNERTAPPNFRDYPEYIELTRAGWKRGNGPPGVQR